MTQMNLIDSIFVINLKRRRDRLETFYNQMPFHRSEVTVFEAVDGHNLKMDPLIFKTFLGNDFSWRRGVLGAALSHYNVWKDMLTSQDKVRVIFEDDTQFRDDFLDQWNNHISQDLPEKFDLIYIGGTASSYDNYIQNKINPSFGVPQYWGRDGKYGAYSYLLSQSGATKLCHWVEEQGIQRGIDGFMSDHYNQLAVFATDPFLCISYMNENSDIQDDFSSLV